MASRSGLLVDSSREKAIVRPSGDQAAERSIPSASSGSRCRPPPSTVKSEAVGATTDCTTRVNAIR